MKEHDIQKIWAGDDGDARQYYAGIQDQVLELARRRSNGVLERIRRIGIWEFVAGGALWVMLLGLFWKEGNGFWLLLGLGVVVFGVTIHMYRNLLRRIDEAHSLDTRSAIRRYITILTAYYKRVAAYTTWGTMIGFFVGLFAGLLSDMEDFWSTISDWVFWTFMLVLMIIGWLVSRWAAKWYLDWSIARMIRDLKLILEGLESE
jgi:hypothetical protein